MGEESLGFLAAAYELRSFNVGGGPRGYCNLSLQAFSRRTRQVNTICLYCLRPGQIYGNGWK